MKSILTCLALAAMLAGVGNHAQAQLIAAKTNALLWGNLTPNLSLELVTSARTSVAGTAFYSLNTTPLNCSIKGVEGQVRYWLGGRPMTQAFVALGAQGMRYTATWSGTRHHGDALGPGGVVGYVLPLNKRWNIEFSAGVSYMWYREQRHDKDQPYTEQDYNATGSKVMPMGVGVSITYIIK